MTRAAAVIHRPVLVPDTIPKVLQANGHRSHFGSKYKSGWCGYAGLLMQAAVVESNRTNRIFTPEWLAQWNQKCRRPMWVRRWVAFFAQQDRRVRREGRLGKAKFRQSQASAKRGFGRAKFRQSDVSAKPAKRSFGKATFRATFRQRDFSVERLFGEATFLQGDVSARPAK